MDIANGKKREIIDDIIKALFDKAEINKAEVDLEKYIKKRVNQYNQRECIKNILENFKVKLFDESKVYRQLIINGIIYPILLVIKVIQKYEDIPEYFFIIIQPLFGLLKELKQDILINYSNRIVRFLTVNKNLIIPFFNEIFEMLLFLRSERNKEIVQIGKRLDNLMKEVIENKNKDEIIFDIAKFHKLITENITKSYSVVIPWVLLDADIHQMQFFKLLPDILPGLFFLLTQNSKGAFSMSENCLNKFADFVDEHYSEYSKEYPELIDKIITHVLSNCKSIYELKKKFALGWLLKILSKIMSLLKSYGRKNKSLYQQGMNKRFLNRYQKDKNKKYTFLLSPDSKEGILTFQKENNTNESYLKRTIFQSELRSIDYMYTGKYESRCPIKRVPFQLLTKTLEIILTENNTEEINDNLKTIINLIPFETPGLDVNAFESEIREYIKKNNDIKVDLVYFWYNLLFRKFKDEIFTDINDFIDSFIKIITKYYNNENLTMEIIDFFFKLAKYKEEYNEAILNKLLDKIFDTISSYNNYQCIFKQILEKFNSIEIFRKIVFKIQEKKDIGLICEMVHKLNNYLLIESSAKTIRDMLIKYRKSKDKEGSEFFSTIFKLWSYNPIEALILSFFSEFFELSYHLILKFANVNLDSEYYVQLSQAVRLIESSLYNTLRIKLLEPLKNIYLVRTLYGILMLLPQGHGFNALSYRMKSVETLLDMEYESSKGVLPEENEDILTEVDKCIEIFENVQMNIKESKNKQGSSNVNNNN